MNTEQERAVFRKRLTDLSDVELTQWSFLVGLVARVDTELVAYHALFAPDVALEPAPDSQLAAVQMLLSHEIKRRSSGAQAKRKRLHLEGEENHANSSES